MTCGPGTSATAGGRISPTDPATVAVAAVLDVPLSLDKGDPASSEDFASSDPDVRCIFSNPGGRASPASFATAVTTAPVVPNAVDQEDPASLDDTTSSDSVKALRCANPGGKASPTDFASAAVATLLQAKKTQLHQKTPRV